MVMDARARACRGEVGTGRGEIGEGTWAGAKVCSREAGGVEVRIDEEDKDGDEEEGGYAEEEVGMMCVVV